MSTLLRQPEVTRRTGLARSTLYKHVAAGEFPAPVKLTAHAVAWREHEIEEWIDSRPPAPVKRPQRDS